MVGKWMVQRRAIVGVLTALSFLVAACIPFKIQLPNQLIRKPQERQAGLIAFIGTDGNIYTIEPGGQGLKAVTQDARLTPDKNGQIRFYQSPTWSNDNRLAYVKINGSDRSASVITSAPDGKDSLEVFQEEEKSPFYLYWSPDGQFLSFLAADSTSQDLVLEMTPARGGDARVLGSGQPYYWRWSPDNHSILYHSGGSAVTKPSARVGFLSLEKTVDEQRIDLLPGPFQAPDWSPDGKELLLAGITGSGQEGLLLMDRKGKLEKALATARGPIAFAWSPDGQRIAYAGGDDPSAQTFFGTLNVIDPGHPQDRQHTAENLVIAFYWSPDGQKLAYFTPVIQSQDTTTVSFSQTAPHPVQLVLSMLDIKSGASRLVATFTPTDEFLNVLPFFDQYQRSSTIWSPDSRNVVLPALSADGKAGIYVVHVAGKEPMRLVAAGSLAFWSPK